MKPTLEMRTPSAQNAIDIFEGRWLTRIEEIYPGVRSGPGNYLKEDTRPQLAARHLGIARGSFHGMKVLELGPMEGMHTYQIDKLGADKIVSVEANSEAYLRCLVMKEILQYKAHFLLGDAVKYVDSTDERWDLIFCSGILYHMQDPYQLIKSITAHTDRIFLWTHYYDPLLPKGPNFRKITVIRDGMPLEYYEHAYNIDISSEAFWGGNKPTACWMTKEAIIELFKNFGFQLTIHNDVRTWDIGHHITATAIRVPDGFEEQVYLQTNEDVRAAVANGQFASGLHHWVQYGKDAGRSLR